MRSFKNFIITCQTDIEKKDKIIIKTWSFSLKEGVKTVDTLTLNLPLDKLSNFNVNGNFLFVVLREQTSVLNISEEGKFTKHSTFSTKESLKRINVIDIFLDESRNELYVCQKFDSMIDFMTPGFKITLHKYKLEKQEDF